MECEEIVRAFPSSFRHVPHNVSGIPATLWLTMWTECEEFVSLNEDAYCLFLKSTMSFIMKLPFKLCIFKQQELDGTKRQ